MTASTRDLSQLSALLAGHTQPTSKKPIKVRPTPANDNKPAAEVLAWPTLERLAHRGDEARAYALRHWRNLNFPGIEPPPLSAHGEDEPDLKTEIRPSEAELLRAVGWTVTGRERWHHTGRNVNTYEPADAETTIVKSTARTEFKIGNLTFRDGKLQVWGRTAKGKPLCPVERPAGQKGSAKAQRWDTMIWSYLALKGAKSPLAAESYQRPFSDAPAIIDRSIPLPRVEPDGKDRSGRFGVAEARVVLEDFGVDGSVPFEMLPVPATRCADGLVPGPQWVGGVKKPKPLGEISSAAEYGPETLRHVDGVMFVAFLRRRLGRLATVLDMAIGDASAKDVGIEMGLAPAYAEKRGAALIKEAIDALIEIDEHARLPEPAENKLAA